MKQLFIGLGSNLGEREQNLRQAIHAIENRIGPILALSDFIETQAWGYNSDHNYLNAVVKILTDKSPHQTLEITQKIEKELGRANKTRDSYQDRTIDIDLLIMEDTMINEENLKLPHPLIDKREFVLKPLYQIAPEWVQIQNGYYILVKEDKK